MTQIRAIQAKDLNRVHTIECAAYPSPWSKELLRDCMRAQLDFRVLEIESGVIVGYIISRYKLKICHILNIGIHPDYQNKGYGQAILQEVLNTCPLEIRIFLLDVRPSNARALHIYKKMGFYSTRVKRGYYRDQQGIENALVMKKER